MLDVSSSAHEVTGGALQGKILTAQFTCVIPMTLGHLGALLTMALKCLTIVKLCTVMGLTYVNSASLNRKFKYIFN